MKVYFYTDEEVGVPWPGPDHDFLIDGKPKEPCEQWPRFVWYDWPGSEETLDPEEADVFVVRQRLIWLSMDQVNALPHIHEYPHRHIFFDLGPDSDSLAFRSFSHLGSTVITATATKTMVKQNSLIVPWCWPVEDLKAWGGRETEFDFVFQGQTTLPGCKRAIEAVRRSALTMHVSINDAFWGQLAKGEKKSELRRTYLESLAKSKVSLCAASIPGVIRYRFYEAMSVGRCIAFICDKCVLPLKDKINYDYFTIFIPADQVDETGLIIGKWLSDKDQDDILMRGLYARSMWEKLLKREIWHRTIGNIVRVRMGL